MTADYILVDHGKMTLRVPRNIFKGPNAEVDEERYQEFKTLTQRRYPWLKDTAMEVILRNSRREMLRVLDEESGGKNTVEKYASQGKNELAIAHLEDYLEEHPDDADSWYALGELYFKTGRMDEGFKAMNKGKSLIKK